MASSDVDQRYLGQLAALSQSHALLSSSLYQILGLSVLLSRRLFRARKLRRLDTSRDTKSLNLYHHILWLSREGLATLEVGVLPYVERADHSAELRVLAAKLRASFYHIFCLFHNNPPVTSIGGGSSPGSGSKPTAQGTGSGALEGRTPSTGQKRKSGGPTQDNSPNNGQGRTKLRDPIPSITSEASYITNPYSNITPLRPENTGLVPTPTSGAGPSSVARTQLPPGLPPGFSPLPPHPSSFILPALNYIPTTTSLFAHATSLSTTLLPGSHPLRLSVALEHSAFLWDVAHDYDGAKRLARGAVREVYRADEGLTDTEFEVVAGLVGLLGGVMRRVAPGEQPTPQPDAEGEEQRTPQGKGKKNERTARSEHTPLESTPERAVQQPVVPQTSQPSPARSRESPRAAPVTTKPSPRRDTTAESPARTAAVQLPSMRHPRPSGPLHDPVVSASYAYTYIPPTARPVGVPSIPMPIYPTSQASTQPRHARQPSDSKRSPQSTTTRLRRRSSGSPPSRTASRRVSPPSTTPQRTSPATTRTSSTTTRTPAHSHKRTPSARTPAGPSPKTPVGPSPIDKPLPNTPPSSGRQRSLRHTKQGSISPESTPIHHAVTGYHDTSPKSHPRSHDHPPDLDPSRHSDEIRIAYDDTPPTYHHQTRPRERGHR